MWTTTASAGANPKDSTLSAFVRFGRALYDWLFGGHIGTHGSRRMCLTAVGLKGVLLKILSVVSVAGDACDTSGKRAVLPRALAEEASSSRFLGQTVVLPGL